MKIPEDLFQACGIKIIFKLDMSYKNSLSALLTLFVLICSSSYPLLAQSYPVSNPGSSLTLRGTSNVHDWKAEANRFRGYIFVIKEENTLKGVEKLEFRVFTESLKSEKDKLTANMHEALKTGEYPFITYNLDNVKELSCSSQNSCTLKTTGSLTVSGVTKKIDLFFDVSHSKDEIILTGKTNLLMTDFNIEPPTALLGLLKTDNEVTVDFKAVFRK